MNIMKLQSFFHNILSGPQKTISLFTQCISRQVIHYSSDYKICSHLHCRLWQQNAFDKAGVVASGIMYCQLQQSHATSRWCCSDICGVCRVCRVWVWGSATLHHGLGSEDQLPISVPRKQQGTWKSLSSTTISHGLFTERLRKKYCNHYMCRVILQQ
jgi:hypothetical protein